MFKYHYIHLVRKQILWFLNIAVSVGAVEFSMCNTRGKSHELTSLGKIEQMCENQIILYLNITEF